jgi:CBS domain-containing protein
MVKDPITVEPTMTIGELCELFAEKNIGGVPVVKNDDVMGIITERDILNAVKRY